MLAAIPLALLAGCPTQPGPNDNAPRGGGKLVPFSSQTEWLDYFKTQAARQINRGGFLERFVYETLAPAPALADTATGGAEDNSGGSSGSTQSFSGTNLQEAGVDESDVVKSDGTNFYIARSRSLRIVRAAPTSAMAEIAHVELTDPVSEMYLLGSKVLLLARKADPSGGYGPAEILIWPPYYTSATLVVYEIDVSDPAQPAVSRRVELDGSLVSSRLTDDRLILVLSIAPKLPAELTQRAINKLTMAEVMPRFVAADGSTSDLVDWSAWLHPEAPDGYFMTAVVALDAANIETRVSQSAILAGAGTIYASPQALYVTDTAYDYTETARQTTAIHKFAFDDNGAATYVASGEIPGRLLNQFSLGEHEGFLRVASHSDAFAFGGPPVIVDDVADQPVSSTAQALDPTLPSNAVYVLGQSGGELNITGKVEGIAPNEQLYSARFLGERGYLVTFRQIDPLFVLNLADPANPQITGELKIPGYSDYLHPVDDTHLIGVGQAIATAPWGGAVRGGVQLSLFDVSDPANPTAVQQVTLGSPGSWCDVSSTHKAFTYLRDRNLLAIPVRLTRIDPLDGYYYPPDFNGVVTFHVDVAAGFSELGRVASVNDSASYLYQSWMRAAIIGDTVYALSPLGVRAAPLSDFTATTTVTLAPGEDDFYGPIPIDLGDGTGDTSPAGSAGAGAEVAEPTEVAGDKQP